MSFVKTLHDSPAREHVVSAVRRMVVHSLNIAGRKGENPGLEIVPPEQIHASLSFLSPFGHFENIQQLHIDLLFCYVTSFVELDLTLFPQERACQGARRAFRRESS